MARGRVCGEEGRWLKKIDRHETSHLFDVISVRGPAVILLQKLLRRSLVLLVLSGVFAAQTARAESESSVDYLTEIKPLLRDKCFSCHGSLKQEGGLRLDAASLIQKGGESGPAYVAGAVAKSLILGTSHRR